MPCRSHYIMDIGFHFVKYRPTSKLPRASGSQTPSSHTATGRNHRQTRDLPRLGYRLMLLCICHQTSPLPLLFPIPIPSPKSPPQPGTSRGRGQVDSKLLLCLCVCSSGLHQRPGQQASEKSVTGQDCLTLWALRACCGASRPPLSETFNPSGQQTLDGEHKRVIWF